MWPFRQSTHEIGAGWVDPDQLGSRLRSSVRLLCGSDSSPASWLGAGALALVILSWWTNASVSEVVHGLIRCVLELLN